MHITPRKTALAILSVSLAMPMAASSGCKKKNSNSSYSQLDHGITTEVLRQGSGGCWAFAADSSIHTAALIRDGKDCELTPLEIMKDCYTTSPEGFHYEGDVNATPGDTFIAVFGLSDGVGENAGPDGKSTVTAAGHRRCVLTEATHLSNVDPETDTAVNLATMDQVKDMIRTKGGVTAGICFINANFYGMSNDYMSLYKDPAKPGSYHHAICLVGWDDGFDKENFGKEYGKELPKHDGAWLAKDSMGPEYGNDGYFWISYESQLLFSGTLYTSDKYSEVIAYDGGCMDAVKLGSGPDQESVGANVFHHKGKLEAVGTYVGVDGFYSNDDSDYNGFLMNTDALSIVIEIRDEKMEKVIARKEAQFDFPGYYVVELDEPLEVEDYSVVVHYKNAVPVESEHSKEHHGLKYITGCEEGQSYLLYNGRWLDAADPKTKETLGLTDAPNNCCIKALYVE